LIDEHACECDQLALSAGKAFATFADGQVHAEPAVCRQLIYAELCADFEQAVVADAVCKT